jgi:hypothetical protein
MACHNLLGFTTNLHGARVNYEIEPQIGKGGRGVGLIGISAHTCERASGSERWGLNDQQKTGCMKPEDSLCSRFLF